MKTSKAYQNLKIDNDKIQISIDGVPVQGKIVYRNARMICVTITSPYNGFKNCSGTVPIFAIQKHNFLGENGELRAGELLSDTYNFLKFYEENSIEISEYYNLFLKAIEYESFVNPETLQKKKQIEELEAKIKELKSDLKAGTINNISYQRSYTPLRKEHEKLSRDVEPDVYDIYRECFERYEDTPLYEIHFERVISFLEQLKDEGKTG
ncbi:MAG: hypothetical protein ACOCG6_02550 [Candidatus Cloacimonadaceae bacterium]